MGGEIAAHSTDASSLLEKTNGAVEKFLRSLGSSTVKFEISTAEHALPIPRRIAGGLQRSSFEFGKIPLVAKNENPPATETSKITSRAEGLLSLERFQSFVQSIYENKQVAQHAIAERILRAVDHHGLNDLEGSIVIALSDQRLGEIGVRKEPVLLTRDNLLEELDCFDIPFVMFEAVGIFVIRWVNGIEIAKRLQGTREILLAKAVVTSLERVSLIRSESLHVSERPFRMSFTFIVVSDVPVKVSEQTVSLGEVGVDLDRLLNERNGLFHLVVPQIEL